MTRAQLRDALDRVVAENIRPGAIGLAFLYVFFSVAHLYLQPEPARTVMTTIALVSAGLLFAFWSVLRKKTFPLRWTHPLVAGLAGVVLFNSIAHLYITNTPRETTNLSLLVVGVGCVFLSARWLTITLVVSFVAWAFATAVLLGDSLSADFNFGLVSSIVLAAIIHAARLRIYTRLEELRFRDEQRNAELEAALKSAEHEIVERKRVEADLQKVREELEIRVLERTEALAKANQSLRSEIEERTRIEAALRTSESGLMLAQKIGHVGSWDFDLSGGGLNFSAEANRILGRAPDEVSATRQAFFQAVHPDDRFEVENAFEMARHERAPFTLEHRIVRPDGSERLVCERAELIFASSGEPIQFAGTIQDITDQRHLETQLRHSQKMDAIGQLAAGVAHDFNNTLTIIQGHASLLFDLCRANAEQIEMLKEINQAADRAARLTSQLLVFSRKRLMQASRLDLNAVIKSWTSVLGRILGEAITLDIQLAPALPMVDADPAMIEQVLMNLTVNARDAMSGGGTLTVRTSAAVLDEAASRANPDARPGYFVRLTVEDTGSGIAASVLPRIFEPFFTTKPLGKGTGLGLSTVYGIVHQHDGWIEVASEENKGTSFHIFLPAIINVSSATASEANVPTVQGGNERIMVVEDEGAVRQLICRLLCRNGYRVFEAASGVEALTLWERHGPEVDLLLTDLVMPGGLSGRELAQKCLAERSDLRVIYTSGYSTDFADLETLLGPKIHFLPKPYQFPTLAKLIRECLDS